MDDVIKELRWRGLIFGITEGTERLLSQHRISFYNGFDPSANSLHVGHLIPIVGLMRFQRFGHTPIAVIGGGTGLIGDPSGKSEERFMLSKSQVDENVEAIKRQFSRFLDFESKSNPAILVNNYEWLSSLSYLDFLRDIGKHFTVNYMLAKESVHNRLDRDSGISYTEFSYMLVQAYDFYHLYKTYNCRLQTGGSDQWGNITAGAELIRRIYGKKVFGMVCPLLTRSDGSKVGKSEKGAIWLDSQKTSPYRFYQFWLNTDDKDVIRYLKYFTWLTKEEIYELENRIKDAPDERIGQEVLAQTMTEMIHGLDAAQRSRKASKALFGGDISELSSEEIEEIFVEVPSSVLSKNLLEGNGILITELLPFLNITSSKGEARRLIEAGGIYLNNVQINDPRMYITVANSVAGKHLLLRKGRKDHHLARIKG